MANYYIGLMSGTSADGIDLALVDFTDANLPKLISTYYQPYSYSLRSQITTLYLPEYNEIDRAFSLDKSLAIEFANAIKALLAKQQLEPSDIIAIGNHGQTIRHRPIQHQDNTDSQDHAFTLQIGCSQTLACLTGIEVIGRFREKDIALGGQGAPLVPAFHRILLSNVTTDNNAMSENIVVNIGGIANITYLPPDKNQTLGFDTGPGNCLLDEWYNDQHRNSNGNKGFDENGNWGASGNIIPELLTQLLSDEYFKASAPKSTGRELFHLQWLTSYGDISYYQSNDVQATLVALTATTIANEIKQLSTSANVWLCGGGRQNTHLVNAIKQQLPAMNVAAIDQLDIDGDALEAMAFAWLAYAYKHQLPSNLPAVTGANKSTTLGVLFTP
ncbi:anhydro-N-acetylmuramic acid kinase [Colwellia sp. MEBiC06753]